MSKNRKHLVFNVEGAFWRRRECGFGFCLFEHKEKVHYAAVQKRSRYGKVSVVNSTNTEKSFILFKLVEVNSEMVALWLTATNIRYLFNIRGMAEEPFDGHTASELTLADLDSTTDR